MKLKFTKLNLSVLIVLFYSIVLVSCDKKDNADDCPNCPSVTGIFPNHAKGLDTIKIVGSNFADDFHSNIVKINGIVIHRDSILSGSKTELFVKIPRLCGSGPVSVDLDAELTHYGTAPQFIYDYFYSVIDIGGSGVNVQPCGNTPVCNSTGYSYPFGIGMDQSGNVFFSDEFCIYKLDAGNNYSPCMFAGCADTQGRIYSNGTSSRFNRPYFFTLDINNTLYVPEATDSIRSVSPNGQSSRWCTNPSFQTLTAFTFDKSNPDISYASDLLSRGIWKILKVGNNFDITFFAGSYGNIGHANGQGNSASFYQPEGLVTDRSGNIYVADAANNTIRKITSAGMVTTLAGSTVAGFANGTGDEAAFNFPRGLFIDENEDIFVADRINSAIRKVTTTGIVTTVYQFTGTLSDVKPTGVIKR